MQALRGKRREGGGARSCALRPKVRHRRRCGRWSRRSPPTSASTSTTSSTVAARCASRSTPRPARRRASTLDILALASRLVSKELDHARSDARRTTRWRSPAPASSGRCARRPTSSARSASPSPSASPTSTADQRRRAGRRRAADDRRRHRAHRRRDTASDHRLRPDRPGQTVFEWGPAAQARQHGPKPAKPSSRSKSS